VTNHRGTMWTLSIDHRMADTNYVWARLLQYSAHSQHLIRSLSFIEGDMNILCLLTVSIIACPLLRVSFKRELTVPKFENDNRLYCTCNKVS
jgi:hypothetical protein